MSKPGPDFDVTKEQDEATGVSASFSDFKMLVVTFLLSMSRRLVKGYPVPPELDVGVTKHQEDIFAVTGIISRILAAIISVIVGIRDFVIAVPPRARVRIEEVVAASEETAFGVTHILTLDVKIRDRTNLQPFQIITEAVGSIEAGRDMMVSKTIAYDINILRDVQNKARLLTSISSTVGIKEERVLALSKELEDQIAPITVSYWMLRREITETVGLVEVPVYLAKQVITEVVGGIDALTQLAVTRVLTSDVGVDVKRRLAILTVAESVLSQAHVINTLTQTLRRSVIAVTETPLKSMQTERSENFTGVEDIGLGPTKNLSDVVGVIERIRFGTTRQVSEVVRVFDLTNFVPDILFVEAIGGIDSGRDVRVTKVITESVGIVERLSQITDRAIAEAIGSIEAGRQFNIVKSFTSDVGQVEDVRNIPRILRSEIIGFSQFVQHQVGALMTALIGVSIFRSFRGIVPNAEIITSEETRASRVAKVADLTISQTDVINSAVTLLRTAVIGVLEDTASRIGLSQTETVGSEASRVVTFRKNLREVIGIVDVTVLATRQLITEAFASIEAGRQFNVVKNLAEVVNAQDFIRRTIGEFERVILSVVVAIDEQVSRTGSLTRSTSHVLGVQDVNSLTSILIPTAVIGLISQRRSGVVRTFEEVVDTIITLDVSATFRARQDVVVGVIDEALTRARYRRAFSSILSVTERFNFTSDVNLSEDVTVVVSRVANTRKALAEIVGMLDDTTRKYHISLRQTIGILEKYDFISDVVFVEAIGGIDAGRQFNVTKRVQTSIGLVERVISVPGLVITETVAVIERFNFVSDIVFIEAIGGIDAGRDSTVQKALDRNFAIAYSASSGPKRVLSSVTGIVEEFDFITDILFAEAIGGIDSGRNVVVTKVQQRTIGLLGRESHIVRLQNSAVLGILGEVRTGAVRIATEAVGIVDETTPFPKIVEKSVISARSARRVNIAHILTSRVGLVENVRSATDYFRTATENVAMLTERRLGPIAIIRETVISSPQVTRRTGKVVKEVVTISAILVNAITIPRQEDIGIRSRFDTFLFAVLKARQTVGVVADRRFIKFLFRRIEERMSAVTETVKVPGAVLDTVLTTQSLVEQLRIAGRRINRYGINAADVLVTEVLEALVSSAENNFLTLGRRYNMAFVTNRSNNYAVRNDKSRHAKVRNHDNGVTVRND